MDKKLTFLEWNKKKWEYKNYLMYENGQTENKWPWYCAHLDKDIERFLDEYGMNSGRVLDLGTCSGSQAIELAQRGFDVLGTDISKIALSKAQEAREKLPKDIKLEFAVDDIVTTRLESDQFDLIIDRGCFHSICVFSAKEYIKNMKELLKDTGKILLKTMSSKETRFLEYDRIGDKPVPMPYPFTPDILRKTFEAHFNIEKIEDTVFYSTVTDEPGKALLTILSKKVPN